MLSKGKTLLLGALFCTELFAGGNKRSQATFIDPKDVPAPPATSTAPLMDTQAFKELARIYHEAEANYANTHYADYQSKKKDSRWWDERSPAPKELARHWNAILETSKLESGLRRRFIADLNDPASSTDLLMRASARQNELTEIFSLHHQRKAEADAELRANIQEWLKTRQGELKPDFEFISFKSRIDNLNRIALARNLKKAREIKDGSSEDLRIACRALNNALHAFALLNDSEGLKFDNGYPGDTALILTHILLGAQFSGLHPCQNIDAIELGYSTFAYPILEQNPPALSTQRIEAPFFRAIGAWHILKEVSDADAVKKFNTGDRVNYRLVFDLGSDQVRWSTADGPGAKWNQQRGYWHRTSVDVMNAWSDEEPN
jgi:hypothetical protein